MVSGTTASEPHPATGGRAPLRRLGRGLLTLLAGVTAGLAGCSVSYYGQAVAGQVDMWRRQQPTAALLDSPRTDPELRRRLTLARELLAFAETELHLPVGRSYSAYADLERDAVLWSVFAAPALDVEPVRWRYPVVGRLAYRGYFRRERADAFADELRASGLDVAVVDVPAYSTLGWFPDPLLNTFLDWEEADLAALLFHELAHRRYYRRGDTAFSEAFAVAVEEEGVRRWLAYREDEEGLARWNRRQERLDSFVETVLATREELDTLYRSGEPEEVQRTRKKAILGDLQSEVRRRLRNAGKDPEDSFWLRDELTNAHLNLVATYHREVPRFEALLRACDEDLPRFYEAVESLPEE